MREMLLTVFGLGHMRPASGTWGSLPPPAIAFLLVSIGVPLWQVSVVLVLLGLAFSIACVRFGEFAEETWGKKDPSQVVADEVAGQSLALLVLPWGAPEEWLWNGSLCAVAFFSFRFFDILKPPPANQLQKLNAGWGILIDDLFAGLYALIVTQGVARLVLPSVFGTVGA